MAMFGKDAGSTLTIHDTHKHLAWIEPNTVFPGLLERIYSSLESVTESHRTISSIRSLIAVNRALITRDHYPQGGQHLVPLLNLLLPAIDMNDPSKSSACLFFISLMSQHVPLMDSCHMSNRNANQSMEMQEESEWDETTRLSTSGFESWVMSFISRLLVLVIIFTFKILIFVIYSLKISQNNMKNKKIHVKLQRNPSWLWFDLLVKLYFLKSLLL